MPLAPCAVKWIKRASQAVKISRNNLARYSESDLMIIGIGNDICNIERIARVHQQFGMRFVNRILTKAEQAEMEKRADEKAYLAKRFSAKEAIYKAIASHVSPPPSWHDAEILNDAHGKPIVTLSKRCQKALMDYVASHYAQAGHGESNIAYHLSLSDDAPFAFSVFLVSASHRGTPNIMPE